jgi:hypothetical protein
LAARGAHGRSEFLKRWLPEGRFSTELDSHLGVTDNEVTSAMMAAAFDPKRPGHEHARATICRQHFRLVYQRNPQDTRVNPKAAVAVAEFLTGKFGSNSGHLFTYSQANNDLTFLCA